MRPRTTAFLAVVTTAIAVAVGLTAGTPPPDGEGRPLTGRPAVPSELAWRVAVECETRADPEACLDEYRLEPRTGLSYVSRYERARLWEHYVALTVPCLAARGIDLPPVTRDRFFLPRERPWNPYPALRDVPFDDLLALYRACPPVPESLLSRHRTG